MSKRLWCDNIAPRDQREYKNIDKTYDRHRSEIGWRLFLGWISSYKREEWYKCY